MAEAWESHLPAGKPKKNADPGDTIPGDTAVGRVGPGLGTVQLTAGLLCAEIKVENGAASALGIIDSITVDELPTLARTAVLLRFRGMPGRYEFALAVDGPKPREVFAGEFEIGGGAGMIRTLRIPRLDIPIGSTGETRLLVGTREGIVGIIPLWVALRS